jgi:hypothetical protein
VAQDCVVVLVIVGAGLERRVSRKASVCCSNSKGDNGPIVKKCIRPVKGVLQVMGGPND